MTMTNKINLPGLTSSQQDKRRTTGGLAIWWLDGRAMNICNSIWHLFGQKNYYLAFVVNFNLSFSIRLWLWADVFQMPPHRQAINVMCNFLTHPNFKITYEIITFNYFDFWTVV